MKEVEIIDWDGVEFGVSVRYADNTTTAYHVGDMVAAKKGSRRPTASERLVSFTKDKTQQLAHLQTTGLDFANSHILVVELLRADISS